jgi:hypothetical protein
MSLDEDDSGRFTELRKKWSAELRYEPEATQSAHVERVNDVLKAIDALDELLRQMVGRDLPQEYKTLHDAIRGIQTHLRAAGREQARGHTNDPGFRFLFIVLACTATLTPCLVLGDTHGSGLPETALTVRELLRAFWPTVILIILTIYGLLRRTA